MIFSSCRADKYLLEPIKPADRDNILIVLGDRKETLLEVYKAVLNRTPIVHIHGGEETVGSYDNQFRHAISKMANLHFVAHESCRERLIRMGEQPETVFTVGSIGAELAQKYRRVPKENSVTILFNPPTLDDKPVEQFEPIIEVLSELNKKIHFFVANNDHGADAINMLIEKFAGNIENNSIARSEHETLVRTYNEMPMEGFHRILQKSNFCIGNSSSFIFEAPNLGTPTIMIGDRQRGRMYGDSVFWADANKQSIIDAITRMNNMLRKDEVKYTNPYYKENCIENIIKIIKNSGQINIKKEFYEKMH